MPFDVNAWLKELNKDGSLSAEDLATIQGAVSKPQVLKAIEEGTLRQSDYSRKMGELQQKEQQTVALQNELKTWKATADKQIETANLTARQKEARLAQIEAAVKSKVTEYGLDINEVLPPDTTPAPTVPTNEPQNPKFISREDWDKAQNEMRATFPLLPAMLHDLSAQHYKLFGTQLENTTELVTKAMSSGKPVKDIWEETFNVADKRKAIEEEAINRRIQEAVQKRETELRSEINLPAARPDSGHSPILQQFKPPTQQVSGSGVAAAVAAFNEGKYRTGSA